MLVLSLILLLFLPDWRRKKQPNKNIQILTVQGFFTRNGLSIRCSDTKGFFDRVKQHQDKLFEINRSLSHSIYGANDNLVLNGSSGQSYFPFIIVFQHMNHLMETSVISQKC